MTALGGPWCPATVKPEQEVMWEFPNIPQGSWNINLIPNTSLEAHCGVSLEPSALRVLGQSQGNSLSFLGTSLMSANMEFMALEKSITVTG